jgi:invasion protein IalB
MSSSASKAASKASSIAITSPIAEAILSAAFIAGGPAAAQSPTFEMPQLIYSPWAKFCGKGDEPGAKEVCFTGKDARTEAGQPVVAATLIEPESKQGKLFRVALPRPLQEQYGARLIIDTEPVISTMFSRGFANACMADYEATPEHSRKARCCISRQLAAAAITFPFPLADSGGNSLAGANEGPPTDPKVFREQQKKEREKRWRL